MPIKAKYKSNSELKNEYPSPV